MEWKPHNLKSKTRIKFKSYKAPVYNLRLVIFLRQMMIYKIDILPDLAAYERTSKRKQIRPNPWFWRIGKFWNNEKFFSTCAFIVSHNYI